MLAPFSAQTLRPEILGKVGRRGHLPKALLRLRRGNLKRHRARTDRKGRLVSQLVSFKACNTDSSMISS